MRIPTSLLCSLPSIEAKHTQLQWPTGCGRNWSIICKKKKLEAAFDNRKIPMAFLVPEFFKGWCVGEMYGVCVPTSLVLVVYHRDKEDPTATTIGNSTKWPIHCKNKTMILISHKVCRSMGRHCLFQDPQSVTVNETPFNSVVVQFTSSEPPLDIESAFAVEDAVANRDPFDTNVSRLFRWGGGQ